MPFFSGIVLMVWLFFFPSIFRSLLCIIDAFTNLTGDRIGVVWKPHTFMPKRFTVLESRLRLVVDGDEGKSTASSQNSSGATILNSVELVALMAAECNSLIDAVEFL